MKQTFEYNGMKFSRTTFEQIQIGLQQNLDVLAYASSEHDADQIEEIVQGLAQNLDVSLYANPDYSWTRMRLLRIALLNNIQDIAAWIDKPENDIKNHLLDTWSAQNTPYRIFDFDNASQQELLYSLLQNVLTQEYADPEYTSAQIREIRLGFSHHIDATLYMRKDIHASYMTLLRVGIEQGVDMSIYSENLLYNELAIYIICSYVKTHFNAELPDARYSIGQLEWLIRGISAGVDITQYMNPELSEEQMHILFDGLQAGLDVSICANPEYSGELMGGIIYGLEQGYDVSNYLYPGIDRFAFWRILAGLQFNVDVSIYARPEYNWEQMHEIFKELCDGLDVVPYLNPELNWQQMSIIRQGMMSGFDVSIYAKPEYSAGEMWEIFHSLRSGKTASIESSNIVLEGR